MNTSNSFNICPRCGNSNTLNAKYCSRCGAQLKVPEEAVVCYKCHTRNSPLANFCRNCGTTLKVGSQTKICPRCGNEVGAADSVCKCGYSFVTLTQTMPTAVPLTPETAPAQAPAKSKKLYNHRGGRGVAVAALILLLLIAYVFVAPAMIGTNITIRPWLTMFNDQGIVNTGSDFRANDYGFDYILGWIEVVKDVVANPSISTFKGAASEAFGGGWSNLLVAAMILGTVAVMAIHLLVVIIRCFSGRRSKRGNGLFLVLAIITTIAAGCVFATTFGFRMPGFLSFLDRFMVLQGGVNPGYMILVCPVYFWFFWIFSLCAKAKAVKEQSAN